MKKDLLEVTIMFICNIILAVAITVSVALFLILMSAAVAFMAWICTFITFETIGGIVLAMVSIPLTLVYSYRCSKAMSGILIIWRNSIKSILKGELYRRVHRSEVKI